VAAGGVGIGIGAAGVGVGVAVVVVTKDTSAYIGENAVVDAKGLSSMFSVPNGTLSDNGTFGTDSNVRGLVVTAVTSESVLNIAAAGAAGLGAGVAGAVTVEVIDSDTLAYIAAGAKVNHDTMNAGEGQDVYVVATNDVNVIAIAGAVGGGVGAGVAGGVDVGLLRNDTTAYLSGDVKARRNIEVAAAADSDVLTVGVSAGVASLESAVLFRSGLSAVTSTACTVSITSLPMHSTHKRRVKQAMSSPRRTTPFETHFPRAYSRD